MRTGFESHLQAPTENRSRDLKGWLTTEGKTVESSCHVLTSVFYNGKQSLCHTVDCILRTGQESAAQNDYEQWLR